MNQERKSMGSIIRTWISTTVGSGPDGVDPYPERLRDGLRVSEREYFEVINVQSKRSVLFAIILIFSFFGCYWTYQSGIDTMDIDMLEQFTEACNSDTIHDLGLAFKKFHQVLDEGYMMDIVSENPESITEVLITKKYGLEGMGEIMAPVARALATVIDELEKDPSLLNNMTKENRESFIRGVLFNDASYFNLTVDEGGLLHYWNPEHRKNLTQAVSNLLNQAEKEQFILRKSAPMVRNIITTWLDTKDLEGKSENESDVLSIMRTTISTTNSANLYTMYSTWVKVMKISSLMHGRLAMSRGYNPFFYWLFNMWTGYGISLIPMAIYTYIMFEFAFNGTFLYVIFCGLCERLRSNLVNQSPEMENRLWQNRRLRAYYQVQAVLMQIYPTLCRLLMAFIVCNVACLVFSHISVVLLGQSMMNESLFRFATERLQRITIIEVELNTKIALVHTLLATFVLLMDVFIPELMMRIIEWINTTLHTYLHGNRFSERRIYDFIKHNGLARRLGLIVFLRYMLASRDMYSMIWKFGFKYFLGSGINYMLLDWTSIPNLFNFDMKEWETMVPWASIFFTIKPSGW